MKNLYLSIILIFVSLSVVSQNTSNLIVFSEDGLKFYLVLNGIRQNEMPQVNVKVSGLNQPYYSAKIIFENTKEGIIEKKYLAVSDQETKSPLEVTYKIKKNKKLENVMRFFSQVPMEQAAPYSSEISEVSYHSEPLPEISSTTITEQTTTTTSGSGSVGNTNMSVNIGGMGVNININDPINGQNMSSTTTTTSYTTSSSTSMSGNTNSNTNQTVVSNQNSNSGCAGATAMSPSSFSAAKQTISKQSFEDTKLTTAKQIMKSNCLRAQQIKELMLLFSFEESKLELAKFGHDKCVDTNNYFLLNSAFQFESSVEELNNALGL
jgi:hypothetical protein